jgi:hypothetical protein
MAEARGRCTRGNFAILLVDRRANGAQRFPFDLHRHHVTRDAQAEASHGAVVAERNLPVRSMISDIAAGIILVANAVTPTKTGNILQDLLMLDGVKIYLLHKRSTAVGKGRQLTLRHRF